MKLYFPYKSDRPEKKFYIITKDNKKVYFGDTRYEHFTITPHYKGHLDWTRQKAYEARHSKVGNWNDPDTRAYWSYRYLWLYPTHIEAYDKIKKDLMKRNYLQYDLLRRRP